MLERYLKMLQNSIAYFQELRLSFVLFKSNFSRTLDTIGKRLIGR
jgi:hypothetical protein